MTWKEQNTNEPRGDYETIGCLSSQRFYSCSTMRGFIVVHSFVNLHIFERGINESKKFFQRAREREIWFRMSILEISSFSLLLWFQLSIFHVYSLEYLSGSCLDRLELELFINQSNKQTDIVFLYNFYSDVCSRGILFKENLLLLLLLLLMGRFDHRSRTIQSAMR